jgi:5'-methylthioadenosine phosphorylase
MVTDYDCWKADEAHVTVEMVLENLMKNAARAKEIIRTVLPLLPLAPGCSCHDALRNAIMTDRSRWPARVKAQLMPILKKYF